LYFKLLSPYTFRIYTNKTNTNKQTKWYQITKLSCQDPGKRSTVRANPQPSRKETLGGKVTHPDIKERAQRLLRRDSLPPCGSAKLLPLTNESAFALVLVRKIKTVTAEAGTQGAKTGEHNILDGRPQRDVAIGQPLEKCTHVTLDATLATLSKGASVRSAYEIKAKLAGTKREKMVN
jgi:hypothetical protein